MRKTAKYNTRGLYFSKQVTNAIHNIFGYPLTIVEAPMGYGKTTAVREQLVINNANVMWQRTYDNSLSNFWAGFSHLFSGYDEVSSQSLLRLQFPNDSVSRTTALNIIEKIELPVNSVIVIDDYHLVECGEINSFIEFLVMSEMANLNFVLTTRYTYFPRLEEFKLKGYLHHIEKEVFELIPKDILCYYKQCGINISNIESEELYKFTEGWISALYLLMLNYDLKGSYSHVADIFTLVDKVVYTPLSEECKDFIINMCIFDSFTIEQAAYVWKGDNLTTIIALIIEKNAFVTYDYGEKTYHIHSILKGFLEEKLERKDKAYKAELYLKASEWYMEKLEYLFAMRYAYLAGNFDSLLKAIDADKGHSINSEYKDLLIKYYEECPEESKEKYPYAVLVFARRMFTFNEIGLFKKACGQFMSIIQNIGDEELEFKNRLLGEYALLLSFTGYNDIEKMSEKHRLAFELLKSPSSILDGRASWTFGSPSVLYMFYRKTGELEKEVQIIREAMPFYYKIASDHGKGAEFIMEAERYYYMGDFENAEIVMHKALQESNEAKQSGIIICSIFLKIKIDFIKGDFFSALNLFKKMREDISVKKLYLFMHTLDMCETYIYSCLNIKEHISDWIRNGEFKDTRLFFPTMAFLNIVYGRVLLNEGEYLKIIGNFENFIRISSVFPNTLGQIHTYIYVAAANNKIFRHKEAIQALNTALEIAMPDKMFMPFVENCDYIESLLGEIYSQGSFREGIARILELNQTYKKAIEQITKEHFLQSKPVLSDREAEIARLAADGLSNKEIGEILFISQNTVKTQLKSIFEKLGINSRVLLKEYI